MLVVARFSPETASVGLARSWLASNMVDRSPSVLVNDAQLCLSELAANAVRHANTDFEVEMLVLDRALRVAVRDYSNTMPELRSVDVASPTGRGLLIVDAVAQRWGVTSFEPAGKSVWCEFARHQT